MSYLVGSLLSTSVMVFQCDFDERYNGYIHISEFVRVVVDGKG